MTIWIWTSMSTTTAISPDNDVDLGGDDDLGVATGDDEDVET